jgi:hypothetical protein
MWPSFGIIVALLVFLALKGRFFPGGRVQSGDKSIEFGRSGTNPKPTTKRPQGGTPAQAPVECYETMPHDMAMDALIEKKYRTIDNVRAAQKSAIEPHYRQFEAIFDDAVNGIVVDNFWRHFNDSLVQAADDNHVLQRLLLDGSIDPSYVASKVDFVRDRHSILTGRFDRSPQERRRGSRLPDWEEIKSPLFVLMAACLNDFVTIATREWGRYRRELSDTLTVFPGLEKRIKRLQEDI